MTMKGSKSIVAFWVLVYILVGYLGVYALDTAPDPLARGRGHHQGRFLKVLAQLNLTDLQKRDIAGILKQHREEVQELRSSMVKARSALVETITANQFNEAAVREAARQAAENGEQLAVLRAKIFGEIRNLLTPEQQETFQKIKADFASRMQKRIANKVGMMNQWIDENS
jgi:Spy/CpxP family protein refolding chaperone